MSAYQLFKLPKNTQIDSSVRVTPGAKAYFYATTTSTPQDTYTTSALNVAHANPVVADANGVFPAIYLNPSLIYKLTLNTSADVLIYTVDPVNDQIGAVISTDLASAVAGDDGARLVGYRRNATDSVAETVGSQLDLTLNAKSFGFSSAGSAAANELAIRRAVAELIGAPQGGVVWLPNGDYACEAFEVFAHCAVRGSGSWGTRLTFPGSSYNIMLGGNTLTGVSKYGCAVSDLAVLLTHKDGHGIRMRETVGAEVSRIYGEGTLTSGRSNRMVISDGGNVGTWDNNVTAVIAHHFEQSFVLQTTGSAQATDTCYWGCQTFGDVASFPNSIGLRVPSGQGSGSAWYGGNIEGCGRGVIAENGCNGFSVHGARFEGNTYDVEAEPVSGASAFIGCLLDNPGHVINTLFRAAFIGCVNGSHNHAESSLTGVHRLFAQLTGDTPLTIKGFPGDTTTQVLRLVNSADDVLLALTNQGKFARIANAAPASVTGSRAGNAALASLLTTLASYGLIVDGSS